MPAAEGGPPQGRVRIGANRTSEATKPPSSKPASSTGTSASNGAQEPEGLARAGGSKKSGAADPSSSKAAPPQGDESSSGIKQSEAGDPTNKKAAPNDKNVPAEQPPASEGKSNEVDNAAVKPPGWQKGVVSQTDRPAGAPDAGGHRQQTAPVSTSVLAMRPFIIKAHLLKPATADTGPIAEATGSVLSQTLDKNILPQPGSDASTLSLKIVRKLISAMSSFARIHKFCTMHGTLVGDENITLGDYLALDAGLAAESAGGIASVDVYYRSPENNPVDAPGTANQIGAGFDPNAGQAMNPGANGESALNMTLSQPPPAHAAQLLQANLQSAVTDGPVDNRVTAEGPQIAKAVNAGTLTEAQWGVVLRNCAVFYGWIIDPLTNRVRRAPQPAFRLRSRVDKGYGPDSAENANEDHNEPPAPGTDQGHDSTQPVAPADGVGQNGEQQNAATQGPNQASVTNNAAVVESQAYQQPPVGHASGAAADGASQVAKPPVPDGSEAGQDLELPSERAARIHSEEAAAEAAKKHDQASAVFSLAPRSMKIEPKIYTAIPNFRVNDDSKIDIAVCKHELALSLAKNDFSSQSTEASVSGGAMGITAGVSAGYASSNSNSTKDSSTNATQTMVARYMYPRCDLVFTPEDLEPTPEFAALLDGIRATKSILKLRKLQANYGQLFCQQLTLGARLLSTKTMSSNSTMTEASQKESFKVSVGVSVSTPYGGASVKHEQEKGKGQDSMKAESTSNETNVFEAVGGDTILANNPNVWATTVTQPETWRVIDRDGLNSLINIVSQMPGYEQVQAWFVQAIPAISKYLTLGDDRKMTCRLKVLSPTNALHVQNNDASRAHHYLGFHPKDVVSPCYNTVDTTVINGGFGYYWLRADITTERRLFLPQTWRAPVIRGFNDYKMDGSRFGAVYGEEFAAVSWNIIAPFDDTIRHGTRIVLQSAPYTSPDLPKADGQDNTPKPAHMVVFRTSHGEYLPAMSDRDEYQYWRILKVGSTKQGDAIQQGDSVRLCWAFSDQTAGFRDYVDDVFGRRQMTGSAGGKDVLFPKVPWPRFENAGHPTCMIMSPEEGAAAGQADPLVNLSTVQGDFMYTMQDLTFRLDLVDNGGRGDSNDYLLKGVQQEGDKVVGVDLKLEVGKPSSPLQMWSMIWGFGIVR